MKNLLLISFVLFFGKAYSQAEYSISGNKCVDITIEFTDESLLPATEWSWDFGDGTTSTQQNPVHEYSAAGTYTIKFSIVHSGSTYSATDRDIEIFNNPVAEFTYDTVLFSSYTRIFTSTNVVSGAKYHWDFGDGSSSAILDSSKAEYKYNNEGTYSVWHKIETSAGCVDSTSHSVSISDAFKVPNVFTPNADGINDFFIVETNGINTFSIDIYSRWGSLVFKRSGHKQIIWDGRMPDGSLVTPGTYFYVLQATDTDKIYEPEKGYITVLY